MYRGQLCIPFGSFWDNESIGTDTSIGSKQERSRRKEIRWESTKWMFENVMRSYDLSSIFQLPHTKIVPSWPLKSWQVPRLPICGNPQGLKQELYTFFFQSREFPLSFYSYSILFPLLLYHSIIWMYFGGQYLSHSKVWKAEPYIVSRI